MQPVSPQTQLPRSPARALAGGGVLGAALEAVLADLADRVSAPATSSGAATAGEVTQARIAVLDCGGGSGSLAVPLAMRGADVTVVDLSIDALSILARRAAEGGVAERVHGIQADADSLAEVAPADSVDLALLHGVLEAVDGPEAVFAAAAAAVRPGGYLSVVVANPVAGVLARALVGDLAAAAHELAAAADPAASSARRFDLAGLAALADRAGLTVSAAQGLGVFTSLVPGSVLDTQAGTTAALADLDAAVAATPPYRDIAASLHLLAHRPTG